MVYIFTRSGSARMGKCAAAFRLYVGAAVGGGFIQHADTELCSDGNHRPTHGIIGRRGRGLLTDLETGHSRIGSAGKGRKNRGRSFEMRATSLNLSCVNITRTHFVLVMNPAGEDQGRASQDDRHDRSAAGGMGVEFLETDNAGGPMGRKSLRP